MASSVANGKSTMDDLIDLFFDFLDLINYLVEVIRNIGNLLSGI